LLGQLILTFLLKITKPTHPSLFPSLLSYISMFFTIESQVGVEGSAAVEGAWDLVARKVKRLKCAASDSPELA
jgi:hypothetical protein